MNDIYYNDYCVNGYPYDSYPINNSHNFYFDDCNRSSSNSSSSSSSMMVSSCSDCSSYNSRIDAFFSPNEGFAKGNMQSNIYSPYKLTNPTLPVSSNERERGLLEVQKYGFAMWDLNLYLNTHPTDRNTMMLFDKYRTSYNKAKYDYESKYGPLHLENVNTNSGYWEWNKNPWPWEVQ